MVKFIVNANHSSVKASNTQGCELYVKYETYPDGNVRTATFSGVDRLDAIKKLVDNLLLYIDVEEIEDEEMTFDEVLNSIELVNGDGCDYIIKLIDKSTGELLMDYVYEEYDD